MFGGIVIRGDGLSKQKGYATANLNIKPKDTKLRSGIYAAWAELDNKKYPAALVVHNTITKVEIHLLGYEGEDFYGMYLDVDPVQKISELEQLKEKELIKKIIDDIVLVKKLLLRV